MHDQQEGESMQDKASRSFTITTAMIDAGSEIMADRWVDLTVDCGFGLSAVPEIVSAIYEAMEMARRQPHTFADAAS